MHSKMTPDLHFPINLAISATYIILQRQTVKDNGNRKIIIAPLARE